MKDGNINITRREMYRDFWLTCPANLRKGKQKINVSAKLNSIYGLLKYIFMFEFIIVWQTVCSLFHNVASAITECL